MGIDTDRFVETVPQEALCPVCCLVLDQPVLTSCGHYICKGCFVVWKNKNKHLCPYCCTTINEKETRSAAVVQSLILNFNVYCKNVEEGCSVVHKLGLQDIHLQRCSFSTNKVHRSNCNSPVSNVAKNICGECHLVKEDPISESHDCLQSLLATCKRLGNQVVNLEYENEKLSLRLTKKENDELDHVTELESLYQQDILGYEKEVRKLNIQISTLEGELNRIRSGSEEVIHEVVINRQNGTLGFNIIGGFQEGKHGNQGIVVSRIEAKSAADGPGKLRLHDRILKVNGTDLNNASHDEAVKAFKCSKDPVHVVVQRRVRRDPPETCEQEIQTDVVINDQAKEETAHRISKSCELTDSPSISCSEEDCGGSQAKCDRSFVSTNDELLKPIEFYDSAYDTLLTHKSCKSTKSSSFSSEITRDDDNENDNIALDMNGNESTLFLKKRIGEVYCDVARSEDSSGSSILFPPVLGHSSTSSSIEFKRTEDDSSVNQVARRPFRKDLNRCLCDSPQSSPKSSPRKFVKKNVFYFVPDTESNPLSPLINRKDKPYSRTDEDPNMSNNKLSTCNEFQDCDRNGMSNVLNDIPEGYEYEYEEISLSKVDGRFGFELCYGGDEESLAVYVGEIEEESVAEQDGRIMVGDQIIMINDAHVSVVEDAYRILQNNNDVKLLVARPVYEVNSPEVEEEETDVDQLNCALETVKEEQSGTETTIRPTLSGSDNLKQSGQSDQTVKDENIINSNMKSEAVQSSPFVVPSNNKVITLKHDNTRDKEHFEHKDDLKSTLKRYVLAKLRGDSDSRVNSKLQCSKESVQPENARRKDASLQKGQIFQNCSAFDSDEGHTKFDSIPRHGDIACKGKNNTKSANGEKSSIKNSKSMFSSNGSLRSALKKGESKNNSKKQVRVDNKPNWTSTEKRVWEEFKLIQHMEAQENKAMVWGQPDQELEWKVRRSKDGKHIYIRKQSKPAKAKLLKERAQRVAEERRGITTDEETQSVYLGKYWTREERRRQLNRQREKRRRLLQRINEKNSINGAEAAIAEIVQRNMTSPGKIFDDFFTVEEILMQRNRDGILEGPIQVTTV